MRAQLLFWPIMLGIVAGGLSGGGVALLVSGWDADEPAPIVGAPGAAEAETRGMVVHLGSQLGYGAGDKPWCNEFHHFCVIQPRGGEDLVAFYTYTTHVVFREQGCQVRWLSRDEISGGTARQLGDASGGYRDPCGGATFDRFGKRVFGPAARDLDQFPVEVTDTGILVDTGILICGRPSSSGDSEECEFAPRVD